jgi:hypothetical protein
MVVKVNAYCDERMSNWLKNQKTQLHFLLEGEGNFIVDEHYLKYWTRIVVKYSNKMDKLCNCSSSVPWIGFNYIYVIECVVKT